ERTAAMLEGNGMPHLGQRCMAAWPNPDAASRPGKRVRIGRNLVFDIGDDLLGFAFASMDHQPARAFGESMTQENDDGSQNRAHAEGNAPADAGGHNPGTEQADRRRGADGSADPEARVDDEIDPAAQARGDQFIDGGVYRRVFAADAGSGQAAKHRVRDKIPRARGESGGNKVEQKGNRKQ